MASSKKRQQEKKQRQQFEKIREGLQKAKEKEVEEISPDDLVVIEGQNDISSYVKFNNYHLYKTKKWTYYFSSFISLIGAIIYVILENWTFAILFSALIFLFPLLMVLLTTVSTKSNLKKDPEFAETVHRYVFKEDTFCSSATYRKRTAKQEVKYDEITLAVNKGQYVYVYMNKNFAFVVNKNQIIAGEKEVLENLLEKIQGYKSKK